MSAIGDLVPDTGGDMGVKGCGIKVVVKNAMKLRRDVSGRCVEDERDVGGVVRRETKVDAEPSAVVPFRKRFV